MDLALEKKRRSVTKSFSLSVIKLQIKDDIKKNFIDNYFWIGILRLRN